MIKYSAFRKTSHEGFYCKEFFVEGSCYQEHFLVYGNREEMIIMPKTILDKYISEEGIEEFLYKEITTFGPLKFDNLLWPMKTLAGQVWYPAIAAPDTDVDDLERMAADFQDTIS